MRLNSRCVPSELTPCLGIPDNRGTFCGEGDTAELRGSIRDPDFTPGTLVIDWGDGHQSSYLYPCDPLDLTCPLFTTTPIPGVVCAIGDCVDLLFFELTHVYANNPANADSRFDINATVAEAQSLGGLSSSAHESAIVHDTGPIMSLAPNCDSSECSFLSHLVDPDSGNVTSVGSVADLGDTTGNVEIHWGDGTTSTVPLECGTGICPLASAQTAPRPASRPFRRCQSAAGSSPRTATTRCWDLLDQRGRHA